MRKINTKSGYIAYSCSALEIKIIGGLGICDECNKTARNGYLVPVLNHYMCGDCFKEWDVSATYYPEDIPFEKKYAAYYEAVIGLKE